MTTPERKRLRKQLIGALLGLAAGIAVFLWRESSVPPAEYLRVAEQERVIQLREESEAADRKEMQGPCEENEVKALPSGMVASCKGHKWIKPGDGRIADGTPTPFGLKGADGVIRMVPPFCGPNAHPINHPQYGPLCVQNEGEWKIASTAEAAQSTKVSPCIDPVNGHAMICQDGRWDAKGNGAR